MENVRLLTQGLAGVKTRVKRSFRKYDNSYGTGRLDKIKKKLAGNKQNWVY